MDFAEESRSSAFSLVELSIVMVILGLLTGGILAGKSLIRAAELRSVPTESSKYITAIHSFRDKYFWLPGDMPNATAFWGSRGGDGFVNSTCHGSVPPTVMSTCNGDGSGTLNFTTSYNLESRTIWQHLSNAGLIEGGYGYEEFPLSKLPNGAYGTNSSIAGWGLNEGAVDTFAGEYGNALVFGTTRSFYLCNSAAPCPLTPEEAWNIDKKMDDGVPGTGRLIPNKGNATGRGGTIPSDCTSAAGIAPPGDAGATYRVDLNTKECSLFFLRSLVPTVT
jgi:prepilin-type N-terminal cleavage/methylation domain-containing protein